MLPFNSRERPHETHLIEDGFGNSLEIPRYGCFTPNEEDAISKYYIANQNELIGNTEAKIAELTIFLRSRFKLATLTSEELAEQAGTMPMIDRLYEFLQNERIRWIPQKTLLDISGEKAQDCAVKAAQEFHAIVASRSDLRVEKRWLVVESLDLIPGGFEVFADYTEGEKLGKLNAAPQN